MARLQQGLGSQGLNQENWGGRLYGQSHNPGTSSHDACKGLTSFPPLRSVFRSDPQIVQGCLMDILTGKGPRPQMESWEALRPPVPPSPLPPAHGWEGGTRQ